MGKCKQVWVIFNFSFLSPLKLEKFERSCARTFARNLRGVVLWTNAKDFSSSLKGFEDSFEVIGVNPSCFGDAFSEKLRKEEREKEMLCYCYDASCSAFTTEMVLITSSSRTLTSPLTTIIYTRKGNAFLSITKNSLLSDASTYTQTSSLSQKKTAWLPSSLCIQSQCSFPLVKIGHWPPDNCWLMVTWEIRIIFGDTYLHFKWHFWLLHSTDW